MFVLFCGVCTEQHYVHLTLKLVRFESHEQCILFCQLLLDLD